MDELKRRNSLTVDRTPHLECPACWGKRMHTDEEWKKFHKNAGKGFDKINQPIKK